MVCLFFGVYGCSRSSSQKTTCPTVLVSVAPYSFFVKEIGKEHVHVKILVPEGANPHTYEPKPKEVANIQDATLWIKLGEPSEEKVSRVLLEKKPGLKVVTVTEGLPLLGSCCEHGHHHHEEEGADLHVWLSPKLAKIQAKAIAKALCELDPAHQNIFEENLKNLLVSLERLDGEIRGILTTRSSHALLVSHPAFAYFCHDYGLTQLSVEVEGKDPRPKEIEALLKEIAHHQIKTIFLEPQHSTKGADIFAQKLQLREEIVDPYSENYLENLRSIALKIAGS